MRPWLALVAVACAAEPRVPVPPPPRPPAPAPAPVPPPPRNDTLQIVLNSIQLNRGWRSPEERLPDESLRIDLIVRQRDTLIRIAQLPAGPERTLRYPSGP